MGGWNRMIVECELTRIKKGEGKSLHYRRFKPCKMSLMRYRSLNHLLFKAIKLWTPITPHLFSFRDTNGKDKSSDICLGLLTYKHHIASLLKASNLSAPKHHTCSPFGTQMIVGKTSGRSLFPNSLLHVFSEVLIIYSLEQLVTSAGQMIELSLG